jgi:predicted oxidoreductase
VWNGAAEFGQMEHIWPVKWSDKQASLYSDSISNNRNLGLKRWSGLTQWKCEGGYRVTQLCTKTNQLLLRLAQPTLN